MHLHHPCDLGGAYFSFNTLMSQVFVIAAAVLYSLYYVPASIGDMPGASTDRTNATTSHVSAATPVSIINSFNTTVTTSGKVDDFTLIMVVGTLSAIWATAVVGLRLTIKREYVGTFVSTRTGWAHTCSIFLDNKGNDARRIDIFYNNESHWRSIRHRVRKWVCKMYAVWQQLLPAWFNESLQARIPDDVMPAQVVAQLNAGAPGGRRSTIAGMGLLRRMTLTAESTADPSESDVEAASQIAQPSRDGEAASTVQPDHLLGVGHTTPPTSTGLSTQLDCSPKHVSPEHGTHDRGGAPGSGDSAAVAASGSFGPEM